jgi:hypothetical protein
VRYTKGALSMAEMTGGTPVARDSKALAYN